MQNKLLESELKWVDDHVSEYDSELHAEAVKGNIQKRYEIEALKRRIAQLVKERRHPDHGKYEVVAPDCDK